MGLKEQLELSRKPKINKPVLRGGKAINEAQKLAKQQSFDAMKANGIEAEERYIQNKRRLYLENLKETFNTSDQLCISNMTELNDFLHVIMSWELNGHGSLNEENSAFNLSDRHIPRTISLFFGIKLGILGETETYKRQKGVVVTYIDKCLILKAFAEKVKKES